MATGGYAIQDHAIRHRVERFARAVEKQFPNLLDEFPIYQDALNRIRSEFPVTLERGTEEDDQASGPQRTQRRMFKYPMQNIASNFEMTVKHLGITVEEVLATQGVSSALGSLKALDECMNPYLETKVVEVEEEMKVIDSGNGLLDMIKECRSIVRETNDELRMRIRHLEYDYRALINMQTTPISD